MSRALATLWLGVLILLMPLKEASAQTLPPIVRQYVAAVRSARTLSVEITQTYRFLPVKKPAVITQGGMSLEKPNKLVVFCEGAEAVSDGVTLTEWNSRNYTRQPAPQTLEAMLAPLRRGLLLRYSYVPAADLAFVLFTHPDALSAIPNLRDLGPDQVDGTAARQVVAFDGSEKATFWFAVDTGLPVQVIVADTATVYTVKFAHYAMDQAIPAAAFAAAPPANLTEMPSEHAALHFLEPGSPAPDFSLKTPEGRTQTLASLKGQPVLVVFCPLWSLPDRALALVQRARHSLPAKDLAVVWIAETDKPESVAAFALAHSEMTVLVDPPPWPETVEQKLYRVQATPTFYVVGRTGRVVTGLLGVLRDGETRQQIISSDTRAAAVSVLLHGIVTQNALSEYDQIDQMTDDASLEAALGAAERTTGEK